MSTAVDITLKVLYVKGTSSDADDATLQQLRAQAPELEITVVGRLGGRAGRAAPLARLARGAGLAVAPAERNAGPHRQPAPRSRADRHRADRRRSPPGPVRGGRRLGRRRRADAPRQALVNVTETLTRIRQSPHLFPAEQRRRIAVLYAGRDPLVWNLLDQVPFVKAERVAIGTDGSCPVRAPGAADGAAALRRRRHRRAARRRASAAGAEVGQGPGLGPAGDRADVDRHGRRRHGGARTRCGRHGGEDRHLPAPADRARCGASISGWS